MEMIRMKKSIVLLSLLFMTLGSLSAAVQFSGNFGLDYKVALDGTIMPSGVDSNTSAAELSLSLSSDYWNLSLRGVAAKGDDVDASASLKLNEILKSIDITLPFTIDVLAGNQNFFGSSVYTDPNGSEGDNYTLYSQSISRGNLPFGVSVGYEDLITIQAGYDVTSKGKFLGAVANPLDGIAVAVNMVNNATFDRYAVGGIGITASAAADIARIAGLDFALGVSGSGWFALDDTDKNNYFAAITGGKDALTGYIEYTNESQKSNINAGAGYAINQAFTASAGVGIADIAGDNSIGAWAKGSYVIADIRTFVKYGFTGNGDSADKHYVQTGLDFSF